MSPRYDAITGTMALCRVWATWHGMQRCECEVPSFLPLALHDTRNENITHSLAFKPSSFSLKAAKS